jgi:hypothetical protein
VQFRLKTVEEDVSVVHEHNKFFDHVLDQLNLSFLLLEIKALMLAQSLQWLQQSNWLHTITRISREYCDCYIVPPWHTAILVSVETLMQQCMKKASGKSIASIAACVTKRHTTA